MKSYKKYWEYKTTLMSAEDDPFIRFMFDPRLNKICICNDHYVANMRFLKNIRRPNRVRNVRHTMECWNRHLAKKRKKNKNA
jgi:hypothetical protein